MEKIFFIRGSFNWDRILSANSNRLLLESSIAEFLRMSKISSSVVTSLSFAFLLIAFKQLYLTWLASHVENFTFLSTLKLFAEFQIIKFLSDEASMISILLA